MARTEQKMTHFSSLASEVLGGCLYKFNLPISGTSLTSVSPRNYDQYDVRKSITSLLQ
jgi:hypothetical protein